MKNHRFCPILVQKPPFFALFQKSFPQFSPILFPQSSTLQNSPPRENSRRTKFYPFTFHLPVLSEPSRSITPIALSVAIFFLIPLFPMPIISDSFAMVISGFSFINSTIRRCVALSLHISLLSTLLVTLLSTLVERSHRKDNEYFYATHKFYSFDDFSAQLAIHNRKYNAFPMRPLNWHSPKDYITDFLRDGLLH